MGCVEVHAAGRSDLRTVVASDATFPPFGGIIRRVLNHNEMNIKSLALSAFIALSSLTGVAAQAAPTTCAFRNSAELHEFYCDHTIRTNANGHKVNDFTFFDGDQRHDVSIIFWMNNGQHEYAEVFIDGKRIPMQSYTAKNGSWCVSNNSHQFCFQ